MSTTLSYLARSGRPEPKRDSNRDQSGFREYELSMQDRGIELPVTLIQTISKMGLGLSKAHKLVDQITDGETVRAFLVDTDGDVPVLLGGLGVNAVRC